jgi:hypothetical protein
MMLAPTKLIAIGMKMSDLATDSPLARSASTAMPNPIAVLTRVTKTTQNRLFQRTARNDPTAASTTRMATVVMESTGAGPVRSTSRSPIRARAAVTAATTTARATASRKWRLVTMSPTPSRVKIVRSWKIDS